MADSNLGFNPPNPFQPIQQGQQGQPPAQQHDPAPVHPDLQRPPVGAPGGPQQTPPVRIPLDFEEYQRLTRLETEYQEMLLQQQQEIEAAEEVRLRTLAEKGNLEEAFNTYRSNYETKLSEWQDLLANRESAWLGAEKDRTISDVMAGITGQLVGEDPTVTAAMVRRLLEGEVEAVMGKDGRPIVRDRERGRPASEYLKERLQAPDFSLFFKARSSGGAGTDGTRSQATPQQASTAPLSYEQAIPAWQRSQGIPAFGVTRKRSG